MQKYIEFIGDSPYGEYKHGEVGELQGFVNGGDGTPCAVVLIHDKFIVAPVYHLGRR